MFCSYIYIENIGSFDGDDMPGPRNDLVVDPDDDRDIVVTKDHEADADRPTRVCAPVPPFARCRLENRLRMELGDQLYALIIKVGVKPAIMRDIQADGRLEIGRAHV